MTQKVLKFAICWPVAQVSGDNAVLQEEQVVPRGKAAAVIFELGVPEKPPDA